MQNTREYSGDYRHNWDILDLSIFGHLLLAILCVAQKRTQLVSRTIPDEWLSTEITTYLIKLSNINGLNGYGLNYSQRSDCPNRECHCYKIFFFFPLIKMYMFGQTYCHLTLLFLQGFLSFFSEFQRILTLNIEQTPLPP